jgi:hypothetical protein
MLVALGVATLLAAGALGYAVLGRQEGTATPTPPVGLGSPTPGATPSSSPSQSQSQSPSPRPSPSRSPKITYPQRGPGTYSFASGTGPVVGDGGTLRRYRVAVEKGIKLDPDDFADFVDATLGDDRSWIAGGGLRLQRVGGDASNYNFNVYLVTPYTAERLCGAVGLGIFWRGEPYTSCQAGQTAVINVTRWVKGIPDYGASLDVYRQYAINHEVGHVFGHGHELCPAEGKRAPVMQQQTFSLQGCTANGWPYLGGRRYAGPPGRIVPPDD